MSNFAVELIKIDAIEPIANADMIELVKVADYRSVVRKGQFSQGSWALYIPESAIVPDWLLDRMGLKGKLAGKDKNRVKAAKFRGTLSQGLVYPVYDEDSKLYVDGPNVDCKTHDGADMLFITDTSKIAELLGITKYEPVIPTHMDGEICNIGIEQIIKYDLENIKRYPDVITPGTLVSVSEKIHGTQFVVGYLPGYIHADLFEQGHVYVSSKGYNSRGLAFKNNEQNQYNMYVSMFNTITKYESWTEKMQSLFALLQIEPTNVYVYGEIYGQGVQDLHYGLAHKHIKVFDIYVGKPHQGRFLNVDELFSGAKATGLDSVDQIYSGEFDRSLIDQLAAGKSVTSNALQIKEGVVIKPLQEARHDHIGRVILKHISDEYHTRSGNVTEYN